MALEIKLYETRNGLQGPVMDWCNRLYNPEVHSLDLYLPLRTHTTKVDPSVVVTLSDNSRYLLKRDVERFRRLVPEFRDTIKPVPALPLAGLKHPPAAVNMNFKPGYFPSLHLILSACHGLQKHHGLFRASAIVADSDFFAIAIVLNVARKCIYNGGFSCTPSPSTSPLKHLWHDVCSSIQDEDYTFWGDTIAEHTKNITRELIYKVARKNIAAYLNRYQDGARSQSMAASVVSRVEIISKRKELSGPTLWDEAWEKTWKKTWNHREDVDINSVVRSAFFPNRSTTKKAFGADVNGRTPGGIAARTVVRTPVPDGNTVLFNALLKLLYQYPEPRLPSESDGKDMGSDKGEKL
jgi:hypothetical protein